MVAEKKTKPKAEKPAAAAKKPRAPKAPAADQKAAAPASNAQVDLRNPLQRRREVVGTVVSDKMQKTIVVKVDRQVRHEMYKKYTLQSRRFKAHDEKNEAKIGDKVILTESRPLSREKRWVLTSILRKAGQTADANV